MEMYFEVINKSLIFEGIEDRDMVAALKCLDPRTKSFAAGTYILHEGDKIDSIYIMLAGNAVIIKTDYDGHDNIITSLEPSDVFGEAAACSTSKRAPFAVQAETDCVVMAIDTFKILRACGNACSHHALLTTNLISAIADRNLVLTSKIDILTARTTREKIMRYLNSQSKRVPMPNPAANRTKKFTVPLDRQQMADFLSVDRSALSRELGKLSEEGIIKFSRNHFELL